MQSREAAAASASNGVLPNVQLLRGVAAMMVVLHHATGNVAEWQGGSSWAAGQAGVDVFFVISGLVMALTATRSGAADWKGFALRRLARILPMYWVATSVKFAAVLAGAFLASSSVDWLHALCSYLLIPAHWGDGGVYPLLFVGWTLNYEMFFYALFCMALLLRVSIPIFLTATIVVLAIVGIQRPEHWPAVTVLLHPMLLEFLFGVWIGRLLSNSRWQLPSKIALPLMAACFATICFAPVDMSVSWSRVIWWGVPGAMLVAVAAIYQTSPGRRWVRLGDASYATYLWHGFVISGAARGLVMLPHYPVLGMLWLLVTAVACAAGGELAHRYMEKPLGALLKPHVDRMLAARPRPRAPAVASRA